MRHVRCSWAATAGLVRSSALRYCRSPEPAEDLIQAGYVGLMKAINNFDPAFGRGLAAYAQPCVTGEIKRHFRDTRWQIHVKRPEQDLAVELRAVIGQLTPGSRPYASRG